MEKEAEPVLSFLEEKTEELYCGLKIVKGRLYGKPCAVVICGIGKVNAACGAQYAIDVLGAKVIVNFGVAGGLNTSLEVGKTYCVDKAVQYDFDLTQLNGTKIGTLDECADNYIPLSAADGYPIKKLGTGDRFNDSKEDFKLLTEVLGADLRDMEGGAIAQVCMHSKIKCYIFKTVSDLAGSGSTTEQYLKNLSLCFGNMKREIKKIAEITNG